MRDILMTVVRTTLSAAIAALRQDKVGNGFSLLSEFLQQFHKASQAGKISGNSERFGPIFQEILVAQAQRKPEALADILEFQLSPLL